MILIALGANQPSIAGVPEATIHAALESLPEHQIRVVAVSRLFRSAAWPDPSDPPYVNAVAAVETTLGPAGLLAALHEVEARFGRVRRERNAPRTLDLDIIDYEGRIHAGSDGPNLPHPRVHERPFVLSPLLDIAPDWRHPTLGTTGRELLQAAETAENRAEPMV